MYFRNYNNLFFQNKYKTSPTINRHVISHLFSVYRKSLEKKTEKQKQKKNKFETKMADVLDLQAEVEDEEFEVDEEGIFILNMCRSVSIDNKAS